MCVDHDCDSMVGGVPLGVAFDLASWAAMAVACKDGGGALGG